MKLDRKRFIPGGPRPHRHRLPADLFPALRRIRLHRPSRGGARRHLRRQDRLAAGAARVLEGLLRRGRRDQGPARQRGARRARRGARPALLPGQRQWRQEPARLPVLRQRPARPEARQVRRLHRLLELSGLPLHPPARHRRCRGRRRLGRQPRRAEGAGHRSGDRQGRDPAQRPLRPLRPARRGRGQGEAQAAVAAEGHDAGRRHLEKALALLVAAARAGPASRDGEPILAGVGRFGPYVKHGTKYKIDPGRRERARDRHEPRRGAAGRGQGDRPRPRCRQAASASSATIPPTRRRSSSTRAATAPT